jgi:hypothetical protein
VVGKTLKIENGYTFILQSTQQIGFSCAGATAHDPQGPILIKTLLSPMAIGLVSALKQQWIEVNLLRKPGHAGRAHAASPAIQPQLICPSELVKLFG